MKKHNHSGHHEAAGAVVTHAAEAAEEAVSQATKSVASGVETARKTAESVRDKAIEGAKATEEVVQGRPFQALAIAIGIGALVGFFIARRSNRS